MKNAYIDPIQKQKIERIKELLDVPCEERTEKMCLELMSFTKVPIIYLFLFRILNFLKTFQCR